MIDPPGFVRHHCFTTDEGGEMTSMWKRGTRRWYSDAIFAARLSNLNVAESVRAEQAQSSRSGSPPMT
jgi:hypothetical protein